MGVVDFFQILENHAVEISLLIVTLGILYAQLGTLHDLFWGKIKPQKRGKKDRKDKDGEAN